MNEYDSMREEIRRLHQVCKSKDQQMFDAIATIKVLLKIAKMTPKDKTYYEKSIIDFEATMG